MVRTETHGMNWNSWARLKLMVWTGTHGFDWNSWYRLEHMYLIDKLSAEIQVILLVLLNHTHMARCNQGVHLEAKYVPQMKFKNKIFLHEFQPFKKVLHVQKKYPCTVKG